MKFEKIITELNEPLRTSKNKVRSQYNQAQIDKGIVTPSGKIVMPGSKEHKDAMMSGKNIELKIEYEKQKEGYKITARIGRLDPTSTNLFKRGETFISTGSVESFIKLLAKKLKNKGYILGDEKDAIGQLTRIVTSRFNVGKRDVDTQYDPTKTKGARWDAYANLKSTGEDTLNIFIRPDEGEEQEKKSIWKKLGIIS